MAQSMRSTNPLIDEAMKANKDWNAFFSIGFFELCVNWILVCICDSNLRKFLVEILDTVGLDKLDYDFI